MQHSTGWRCVCHRCDYGTDGFMTKRGARKALIRHLNTEHPTEEP